MVNALPIEIINLLRNEPTNITLQPMRITIIEQLNHLNPNCRQILIDEIIELIDNSLEKLEQLREKYPLLDFAFIYDHLATHLPPIITDLTDFR